MFLRAILWLLALMPAWAGAADVPAIVTIAEGDAVLVRESTRYALAEGVALRSEDIVETAPRSALLRIEWKDGRIVDLGPQTAVQLAPRLLASKGERRPAQLYVLQGWVKLSALPGGSIGWASPAYDVSEVEGVAVAYVGQEAFVFAETRPLKITERTAGLAARTVRLKSGESYLRAAGGDKAEVATRAPSAMLERMPRAFRDSLPPLAERFKARQTPPKEPRPIDYADVKGWLQAERALRSGFVARWKALAEDPGFRQELTAHLRAHPEWDRVLHPEKYLPNTAPVAAGPTAAR